ncbi:hypothetical protein BVRB_9g208420 [Beta vulgaris subsp. vulgaris]|nr:hypothetical protein BVRB_9g208420 [Beta vulgaris subsp. vulgaris]
MTSPKKLKDITIFSRYLSIKQLQAPRRQCCDVLPPKVLTSLEILIRECRDDELIMMHA